MKIQHIFGEVKQTPFVCNNKKYIEKATGFLRNSKCRQRLLSSELKTPLSKIQTSSKTSSSNILKMEDTNCVILGVTEGRGQARGEVGIACMDPTRPHLILCQISDGQRYTKSLSKLNCFNFTEMIVPDTFIDRESQNGLYSHICSRFPSATLTSVQRRHFSEIMGTDLIKRYCSYDSSSVMTLLQDKFYALAAAAALIKYLEFTHNIHIAHRSLKVEYQGTEDIMLLDLDTAIRLELIMSNNFTQNNSCNNLMSVLNHCHTKGGVKLLRTNILQPYYSLNKINNRLNCVAELVNNPLFFCKLEGAIRSFGAAESLLNLCMYAPQQDGIHVAECQLKYTLQLKNTLELLPKLMESLTSGKTEYFHKALEKLNDPRFNIILSRIFETVSENTSSMKSTIVAHVQGCFSIKTGVNSLLDVAKKTYCEIVQEINEHVKKLREVYDMPLKVSFSSNKGFHIQCVLPPKPISSNLPEEFILIQKSKTVLTFYTPVLVALDQRSKNILDEIKLMTNAIVFDMLNDIREHIGCLFDLCEIVAELDVVLSFAHVSSLKNYVKPNFGNQLLLEESRHPILDFMQTSGAIPNNVLSKTGKNFAIITGPNQSGKSIYIRQIALLQIIAQIGCFVPAKSATFKIMNRLFTKIGCDDNLESNASTLIAEMREIEYMKRNFTPNSIIIIDELCKGTSVEEGTNLAFAVCEELLDSSAFVFLTTHFTFLTRLEELYSSVTNYHFEMKFNNPSVEKSSPHFPHIIKWGASKIDEYGLQVSELTSFPKEISKTAQKLRSQICINKKISLRKINGFKAKHELAIAFRRELWKKNSTTEYEKIKPLICHFKEKYLGIVESIRRQKAFENPIKPKVLHKMNEYFKTLNTGKPFNFEKCIQQKRRAIEFLISKKIKQKYVKLIFYGKVKKMPKG